jgi:hypothetical protein
MVNAGQTELQLSRSTMKRKIGAAREEAKVKG